MSGGFLGRLHRDQRGYLSPIILFLTIGLAYMVLYILNTGQMLYDKQRTQDTADAAALVHADWSARYLNIMAMNNVAASQATVLLATSTAYQLAVAELFAKSTGIVALLARYSFQSGYEIGNLKLPTGAPYCQGYDVIPLFGPMIRAACIGFQGIRAVGATEALAYTAAAEIKYYPFGVMLKARAIINAMNDLNAYLVDSFPERVGNEALNLVRINNADHLVFHPACNTGKSCSASKEGQGGNLPVKRGLEDVVAYKEMCDAMGGGTQTSFAPNLHGRDEFSKRGFPNGKGPLTAGGIDGRPIRDFVNDKSDIDVQLPVFYVFYEGFGPKFYTSVPVKALVDQFNSGGGIFRDFLIDGAMFALKEFFGIDLGVVNPFQLPIDPPLRYTDTQTKDKNDFTRKFDSIWGQVCGVGGDVAAALGVQPQPYWLKGRIAAPLVDPALSHSKMAGDQLTDYRALAVVSRLPRARLRPTYFRDKTAAYAYAESWVHNYTAFDLYTQDWLASLAPTSLAGDVQALSDTIRRSPAADSFKPLTAAFDKGGKDAWSVVSTH